MAIPLNEAREAVASLFIAYLGRAPEYEAMNFYIGQLNRYAEENGGNNGDAVLTLSAEIFNNAIGANEFPDPQSISTEDFVTSVYRSALGREPDEEGLAYYTELLNSGGVSREIFVQAVLDNARGQEGGRDYDFIANRTAVAVEFSKFENSNPQKLPLLPYDAKTILEGVNEDPASVEAALERIADAENQGEGFGLTVNEDNLTGTGGDDTFTGPISVIDGNPTATLQSFDTVDGGGGRDTLNATLVGGGTGEDADAVAPTLTNVEVVNLRVVNGEAAFDMSNTDGVEQVWNRGSSADSALAITGASTDTTFGIENTSADLDIRFAEDGDADELKLAVNGAREAAVTAVGAEALLLNVTGTNVLDVAGLQDTIETVTIAGDGTIDLTNFESESLKTLDATGLTGGGLTLDISAAGEEGLNVATGAGNDVITVNAGLFAAPEEGEEAVDVAIDLGEGENTLVVSTGEGESIDALNFKDATVSGVTTLEIAAAVAGGDGDEDQEPTIDLEGVDVQNLVFSGGLAGNVQLANTATTLAVTVDSEAAAAATLDFVNAEELTLNLEGTGVGKDGPALTLTGEALSTVTVNVATDEAAEGASGYNLVLDDVAGLSTLILGGGAENAVWVNATDAEFEGAVTVQVGDIGTWDAEAAPGTASGIAYLTDTANGIRETFQFTGEDITTAEIIGFNAGVGANADRLDFSQFEGIESVEDLDITYVEATDDLPAGTVINAAGDQFSGSIFVVGVDISSDAANFIF